MSARSEDFGLPPSPGRYSPSRLDVPNGTYEGNEIDIGNGNGNHGPTMTSMRRQAMLYRPVYLSEDETVLACCHHAHEVARAHGAKEVVLEHLAHALARVPAAVAVLEERSVNVDSLRRESATVISSEIPVDQGVIPLQLKAAKDFNTVMYLAAAGASRRDERSIGVRDVLEALLAYDPKLRAVRMIRRHLLGDQAEAASDPLAEVRATIDRYSAEVRELRLAVSDLRSGQIQQTTSTEKTLASLMSELVAERSQLAERMKVLQDTIVGQRSEAANLQRLVLDRLQTVERTVVNSGGGAVPAQLGERLQAMQRAIEAQRQDTARIEVSLGERVKSLDESLELRLPDPGRIEAAVIERLRTFERTLETVTGGGARNLGALGERLQALERALGSQRAEVANFHASITGELKALEKAMASQPGNGVFHGQLTERLLVLERMLASHRSELASFQSSFGSSGGVIQLAVEKALEGRSSGDPARFEPMLKSFEAQLAAAAKSWTGASERIAAVEQTLGQQGKQVGLINQAVDGELMQIRKALVALGHAQQTLSTAIDEWRLNNSGDLSVISNRLESLEKTALTSERSTGGVLERVDRALKNRYTGQA